jgi:hypothetical protein
MSNTKKLTSVEWAEENPTLRANELGVESDTKKQKLGDGFTRWNELSYQLNKTTADARYAPKSGSGGYLTLDGNSKVPEANLPTHLTVAAQNATYVRFVDEGGNPLAGKHVVIKVSSTTGEILDIVAEA